MRQRRTAMKASEGEYGNENGSIYSWRWWLRFRLLRLTTPPMQMKEMKGVLILWVFQGHLSRRGLHKRVLRTSEEWRSCPCRPWAPNEVGLHKAAVWLTICKDTLWLMLCTRPFGLYSACMCAHKPSFFLNLSEPPSATSLYGPHCSIHKNRQTLAAQTLANKIIISLCGNSCMDASSRCFPSLWFNEENYIVNFGQGAWKEGRWIGNL